MSISYLGYSINMDYFYNLDMDIIKFEVFKWVSIVTISQFISTCKSYYNKFINITQELYILGIDKEYKDIYSTYLSDANKIGIINIHIKNLYSMKRLNNYIECTNSTLKKKLLGLYLNIPKVAVWYIDDKKTVIIRTQKQLVKSIYLYFGLKIHKYYWSVHHDQEKLLNLMGHRKYYIGKT